MVDKKELLKKIESGRNIFVLQKPLSVIQELDNFVSSHFGRPSVRGRTAINRPDSSEATSPIRLMV